MDIPTLIATVLTIAAITVVAAVCCFLNLRDRD